MNKTSDNFKKLVQIMSKLRAPGGCPWDREQDFHHIAAHTIEEAHEVVDAIDRKNYDDLKEELGDLLLQVIFHSEIADERGLFNIDDVIQSITDKLIRRHPHVFGDKNVKSSEDVTAQWEKIKISEGKKNLLGGLPKKLPALLRAFRVGEKASRVGFDWPDAEGILDKVEEEARELHEEKVKGSHEGIEEEYGDLLFTIANLGRFIDVDPEGALRCSINKFQARFEKMEEMIKSENKMMNELSLAEWEEYWNKAKDKISRK